MKEIIENILEEEKAARERVEKANHEAKQIRIDAESKARKIIIEAQEKGVQEAKSLIEKARIDAENEKSREMEKIKQKGESIWDKKKSLVNEIVDVLFQKILGEDLLK